MSSVKKDESSRKKEAFKSFLETSASPATTTTQSKKNASDNEAVFEEQYVEVSTSCNVCGNEVPDAASKKKNCGFCEQVTCQDHLRKRRRKKNKWEKICDNCEDKYLYDTYMKLEIKAQQSLAVEEQIVAMKHDDAKQVLDNKQVRRRQLSFFSEQMNQKYDNKMMGLIKQDNRMQSLGNKIESDELTCNQVEQYITRMKNKIKSNYQEDYRILTEQDERLGAQLARIQKKCSEVRSAIERREKQLEDAYQKWQRKQYGSGEQQSTGGVRSPQKKQEGCFIF